MTAIDVQNELTLGDGQRRAIDEPASAGAAGAPVVLRRFLEQRTAVGALVVLVLIVIVAVFAPGARTRRPERAGPAGHPPAAGFARPPPRHRQPRP